jgi:hypothetical protein
MPCLLQMGRHGITHHTQTDKRCFHNSHPLVNELAGAVGTPMVQVSGPAALNQRKPAKLLLPASGQTPVICLWQSSQVSSAKLAQQLQNC